MADLHIVRKHTLGLAAARKIAFNWAEQVENELGMSCTYEKGRSADTVCFSQSGVQGELQVTKDSFELDARLGFLVSVFKGRIETQITQMLDQLVPEPAARAAAPVARKSTARKAAAKK